MITSQRLILRPWRSSDAEALYALASDPAVGPPAGWPPHESVVMSREIIETVFAAPEVYALVLKDSGTLVGCCGLVPFNSDRTAPDEAEIGYWIGREFWGNGYAPEAVLALEAHAFSTLGKSTLWIAFTDGNEKSRRVAEKCGYCYSHTRAGEGGAEHFFCKRRTLD